MKQKGFTLELNTVFSSLRKDFTFINPSLWQGSFSAVVECSVLEHIQNIYKNIGNVSFGYCPYGLIFHSSVKSHVQILFS